ncbi:DeoR family fructose operon transcriptional repressor [Alkalihalobacillus xiaoxiensis]|uniref:DeoR family fructose operon transcriptional repressor n=1 Tax=Shouchella xiaoxiensis TaxID=766895 RepID=A0ABS2SSF4_9BACI|nr:DeoR/GlpR family DNA-binding transcription regulator [Shouchella xiaoxiensis]MBM7837444.1 DeoR family fructose operon transcriptional repressor [Shouchella xiaoxiensis]
MLTLERKEMILALLQSYEVVKIQDILHHTGASESTIRRDLTELEQDKKLKRIHGGATLLQKMRDEPTMAQKTIKNSHEKRAIAQKAAEQVCEGDCLFLDAGTTTYEMIPFLKQKNIVVVTNGLMNIPALLEAGVETHVLGGHVKSGTHAFVGRGALETIDMYRFDHAFMGTNGVTVEDGCTTPDPEEAHIKAEAIKRARNAVILADHTKFGDIAFSRFAHLKNITLVTSSYLLQEQAMLYEEMTAHTAMKVVKL